MKYLLDTCVLSELVKRAPDAKVLQWFEARQAHELCTSAMTLAELLRGVAKLPSSKRRSELTQWLENLHAAFEERVLPFDQHVARTWAQMTVQAETQGKTLAALDSIIAATALAHGCQLVTRNVRDFAHSGVLLVNPWQDD